MDPIYPRYAHADPTFYDEPGRRARDEAGRYSVDSVSDWSQWRHVGDGHWSYWYPPGAALRDQGWKLHVSTVPADAREMLDSVSRYCHHRSLAFKHLAHREILWSVNGKEGDRSASGKFITIYPADESELHDALVDLDGLVGGLPGPYVLSDLRWNAGPVSVRYGAFLREFVFMDGVRVPALRDPAGTLVEDVRAAAFIVPEWVSIPPFLRAQQASLGTQPPPDLPRVTSALHHSNAGGVYEAIDFDGAPVVLKEARPHAGLTPDGRDAVTRVRDEARVLSRIDSPSVVGLRRLIEAHGHHFLVLDRVDGVPLQKAVVTRHPLVQASSTAEDRRRYGEWALRIFEQVDAALAAVHAAGYSHGDLHPGNVLITPDDRVVLLDFEMARPLGDDTPAIIGAPGFVPRDARGGERLDRYAFACIRLFVFAPLTTLFGLDPAKTVDLIGWASDRFALEPRWGTQVLSDLDLPSTGPMVVERVERAMQSWPTHADEAGLEEVIRLVGAQLASDADFERSDRAWPGDPAQFAEPGFSLAHGAGGIILALRAAGVPIPEGAWSWLDQATNRELAEAAPRLGLLDGLSGLVWVQRQLGAHAVADRVVDCIHSADLHHLGIDAYSGLSGVGLMLLEEVHADGGHFPLVLRVADRVEDLLSRRAPRDRTAVATGAGGLLRGGSGVALFASRLFAVTQDERHLHLAERAAEDDLTAGVWADDGSFQIDEGWRALPYLGSGSAGLGLALIDLLPYSEHRDRYADVLSGIRRAASAEFVAQSGLFEGRAGLIHFLLALRQASVDVPETEAALAGHIGALRLHAVRRADGLGFPGRGLLRLSCDLATGAAGVLSALTAYRDSLAHPPRIRSLSAPFPDSPRSSPFALVGNDPARTH